MKIGLILVGDEILSGRRADKHLPHIVGMLGARGLCLGWAQVLGDDRSALADCFRLTLSGDDLVFVTGGIGATPDDLTRAAVAEALAVPLQRHPEGVKLLEESNRRKGREMTEERYRLVEFPAGADLIPNPYNGIPGFRVEHHHFVPGFPEMAWPMLEWVLDVRYPKLRDDQYHEESLMIAGAPESQLIPIMEGSMRKYPEVGVFSLPILEPPARIELGVKGNLMESRRALEFIKAQLDEQGISWRRHE